MMTSKRLLAVAVSAALYAPLSAFATNGMNMEGYGPIATGMGGASMAYDNGTAAVMNNPATLGLMAEGDRIDIALGALSPNVHSDAYGQDSKADLFLMPAAGWIRKSNNMAYGVGVFSQGGMGTEYDLMPGMKDRSEVGVGRLIFPFAYNLNSNTTVAASVDYVWATMDLQMTAPLAVLGPMVQPTSTLALPPAGYDTGRFDFSDDNDFSGKATGNGFAGKLGVAFKATPSLTIGATYHSETAMGDLEASGATLMVMDSTGTNPTVAMSGKIKVKDFQWPATIGVGMSYQASDALMVVADVKQIKWSDVMDSFKMTFENAGGTLDVVMPQKWDDQTVFQVGAAYKFTQAFTGRAGLNLASNPIPDQYVNPLFPAIVENHLMLGAGYSVTQSSDINFSMTYAPEVEVTSPTAGKITHSQLNWQLMYSNRF